MQTDQAQPPSLPKEQAHEERTSRRTYAPPRLERLGEWSALTLQQSIPIGPGSW